jgi:enamine deaminase RidA (YjgF/YER057c/UK114 family)
MPAKRLNPPELYDAVQYGFSHAAEATGGRTIHCAGQVAWDKDYTLVGEGDLAAQARQCLANLRAVLASAGATPADIVRIRTYVVDHTPDKLGPWRRSLPPSMARRCPPPTPGSGCRRWPCPAS